MKRRNVQKKTSVSFIGDSMCLRYSERSVTILSSFSVSDMRATRQRSAVLAGAQTPIRRWRWLDQLNRSHRHPQSCCRHEASLKRPRWLQVMMPSHGHCSGCIEPRWPVTRRRRLCWMWFGGIRVDLRCPPYIIGKRSNKSLWSQPIIWNGFDDRCRPPISAARSQRRSRWLLAPIRRELAKMVEDDHASSTLTFQY